MVLKIWYVNFCRWRKRHVGVRSVAGRAIQSWFYLIAERKGNENISICGGYKTKCWKSAARATTFSQVIRHGEGGIKIVENARSISTFSSRPRLIAARQFESCKKDRAPWDYSSRVYDNFVYNFECSLNRWIVSALVFSVCYLSRGGLVARPQWESRRCETS